MDESDDQKVPQSARSRLELRARRTILRHAMLSPGDHVLVALSGGADSVALLHVLIQQAPSWRLTVSAAHLNHRLRGRESDQDEEFVRALCSDLGILCIVGSAEVHKLALEHRINIEEAAREARYEFLRSAASQAGARKIALGHTRNDQAETAIMRFLRGSGPEGMASIHPVVEGLFIRPLIDCTRTDILRYIDAQSLSYRTDSSNSDLAYRRNRVRHELIPYLESHFNPRLIRTLTGAAEASREVFFYLQTEAEQQYRQIRKSLHGKIALPAERILALHPGLRGFVIRRAIEDERGSLRGISSRHIENVIELCSSARSGRRLRLPGKCMVERSFSDLVISQSDFVPPAEFEYRLPLPGACSIPELGLEFIAKLTNAAEMRPDTGGQSRRDSYSYRAEMDGDALSGHLLLRSRRPGDRYGGSGHRKVKKMLIDARIDRISRAKLPLLVSRDAVAWIPGFKPAAPFQCRPDSKTIAIIEVLGHR